MAADPDGSSSVTPITPLASPTVSTRATARLQFLSSPECNANFSDRKVRRLGRVRAASVEDLGEGQITEALFQDAIRRAGDQKAHRHARHEARIVNLKRGLGVVVLSVPVQFVVFCLILFDVIVAIYELGKGDQKQLRYVIDIVVVVVLGTEVFLRIILFGKEFFYSCINIMEFALVPLTLLGIFLVDQHNVPLPVLKVIRPIFKMMRFFRILVIGVRRGQGLKQSIRRRVAEYRKRFVQDGFDLDLAYIGPNLIATSAPGVGVETLFRNSWREVARFLNERHPNAYLLVNLTEECGYPLEPFFHRYANLPILQNEVPSLLQMLDLCELIEAFLKMDPKNVICLHSKAGRGRTGMACVSWLLYSGACKSSAAALTYFEHCRTDTSAEVRAEKGEAAIHPRSVDTASQIRFLEYFARLVGLKRNVGVRNVRDMMEKPFEGILRSVTISNLASNSAETVNIRTFQHPAVKGDGFTMGMLAKSDHSDANEAEISDEEAQKNPKEVQQQEDVRIVEDRSVKKVIMEEMDASRYDTVASGGKRCTGTPTLDTKDALDDPTEQKVKVKVDRSGVVAFAIQSMSSRGEIKFEIWDKPKVKNQDRKRTRFADAICCRKRVRRSESETQQLLQMGRMLFSFWLHTSFLSHDEEPPEMFGKRHENTTENGYRKLVLQLKRFDVDKAAGAPKLWSYSSLFSIQLEFEVQGSLLDSEPVKDMDLQRGDSDDSDSDAAGDRLVGMEVLHSVRISWVNWVVKQIWPHVEAVARHILYDKVEPLLNDSVPAIAKPVKVKSFNLGKTHPVFGPLNAVKRSTNGPEIQIDIGIKYHGDVNVLLELAGIAELGVSHLSLCGVLSVKLCSFIDQIPVVGSLEFFFLNVPDIDLSFAGSIELANLSVIRRAVVEAIQGVLLKRAVLPNMVMLDIRPEAISRKDKMVKFVDVVPVAVLRLTVVEATRLVAADWSFWTQTRTSDPYCVVQLGDWKFSTDVIQKTTNPVWNTTVDLLVHDWHQNLTLSVYDYDFGKSDDLLGRVKGLPCVKLLEAMPEGLWLGLDEVNTDIGFRNTEKGPVGSQLFLTAEAFGMFRDRESFGELLSSCEIQRSHEEIPQVKLAAQTQFNEPKDDGAGVVPERDRRNDAPAALLVFQIVNAVIPPSVAADASDVTIEIKVGNAKAGKHVQTKYYGSLPRVSEQVQNLIRQLARTHLTRQDIASLVMKHVPGDSETINQLIDKSRGINGEIKNQRIFLLIKPQDLAKDGGTLHITALVKGSAVGSQFIPLTEFTKSADLEHSQTIHLRTSSDHIQLKVEASVSTLKHYSDDTRARLVRRLSDPSLAAD